MDEEISSPSTSRATIKATVPTTADPTNRQRVFGDRELQADRFVSPCVIGLHLGARALTRTSTT